MKDNVLLVDDDEVRRRTLAEGLAAHGLKVLEVNDAFAGMAALGRTEFLAVVAVEGQRPLSLRGLFQLARRRHPDVVFGVVQRQGSSREVLIATLDQSAALFSPDADVAEIARVVRAGVPQPEITEELERPTAPPASAVPIVNEARVAPVPMITRHDNTDPGSPLRGGTESRAPAPIAFSDDEPTARQAAAPGPAEPGTSGDSRAEDTGERAEAPRTEAPLSEGGSTIIAPAVGSSLASRSGSPPLRLEGQLEGQVGGALLVSLFAQDLTGRLVIDSGAARGGLYLFHGEPVWCDDAEGDGGLFERLRASHRIDEAAARPEVPEGQLLGALVQRRAITGQAVHEFLRAELRRRVLACIAQPAGGYRFEEDRRFLEVAPLFRLNPFGLLLEHLRGTMSPAALLDENAAIGSMVAIPEPALATLGMRLASFTGGIDPVDVLDGQSQVSQIIARVGLDPLMGTLVVLALRDARVIALESAPRRASLVTLGALRAPGREAVRDEGVTVIDGTAAGAVPSDAELANAQEAIFALYMKLKPLTAPAQVLDISAEDSEAAVDAAYARRTAELDVPLPDGDARDILEGRLLELRRKVDGAYRVVKAAFAERRQAEGTDSGSGEASG